MNCLHLSLLCLTALLLSSCTSSLSVSDQNPVAPVYEQGDPILISQKQSKVLVRLLSSRFSGENSRLPQFLVVVENGSKATLDFSTTSITAQSGSKRARIYTYEALRKRIETAAAIMAFAGAMNAASQSMAASMPQQSYHTGSVHAYGSGGGYASANYTGTTTTYNPAASAVARSHINANAAAQMASIADARDAALADTTSMLRRNTIPPRGVAGGVIKLYAQDLQRKKPLKLSVQVHDETHEFYFDVGT